VDRAARALALRRRHLEHRAVGGAARPRKQDPRLLEALADRAEPVRRAVDVARRRAGLRDRAVLRGGEVAAGEDVGGGEGGGGLDAVEEEDLVEWGDEEDAVRGAAG